MIRPRVLAVLILSAFAACYPLDPLGDGPDNRVSPLTENIFSGDWNLENIRSANPPFGDIDSIYLDGEVPETVGFEIEGQQLVRHRVLLDGGLKLEKKRRFSVIVDFGIFTTAMGVDTGPANTCRATRSGRYEEGNGILRLIFDDDPDSIVNLFEDGAGLLRLYQLPVVCSYSDQGQDLSVNILLSDLIFTNG